MWLCLSWEWMKWVSQRSSVWSNNLTENPFIRPGIKPRCPSAEVHVPPARWPGIVILPGWGSASPTVLLQFQRASFLPPSTPPALPRPLDIQGKSLFPSFLGLTVELSGLVLSEFLPEWAVSEEAAWVWPGMLVKCLRPSANEHHFGAAWG